MEKLKQNEHPPAMKLFDDPDMEAHIWHLREEGLGATARVPGDPDNWEGWEDAAVPPDKGGAYPPFVGKDMVVIIHDASSANWYIWDKLLVPLIDWGDAADPGLYTNR